MINKEQWVKTPEELDALRESGRLLAMVMVAVGEAIRAGVSTKVLDDVAERKILELGGSPIFKGYPSGSPRPFPASICTSLNNEVVHGIPSTERIIHEGDLVKIDMGLRYQGMVSDMARTFAVGKISTEAQQVMDVTRESLERGIAVLRPGARLRDFSRAVAGYVEENNCSVVRDLVGHGVGYELHEEPYIPNWVDPSVENFTFLEGMSVALEPMINLGTWKVRVGDDDWTYETADGRLSAHFEDTVIITREGSEVVTRIN
ncbi:MAG: type I methionyl aminopeptidase [Candidatus Moraniibacteriota bacterium]